MSQIAIYAGSFDPPTVGHLDIVERAAKLFDPLVVAIGVNRSKTSFLGVEERLEALRDCLGYLPGVEVAAFEGMLVDFARKRDCKVVVRGLRAISDFEYEFRGAMANRRLAPEIDTVFLMTREDHSFLASSVVKEVAEAGGDFRGFVPAGVVPYIERRLALRGDGA